MGIYPSEHSGRGCDIDSAVDKAAARHVRLDAMNRVVLSESAGAMFNSTQPTIEADDLYLRIGCMAISYDAFRLISEWWEGTRKKSPVRKMQ